MFHNDYFSTVSLEKENIVVQKVALLIEYILEGKQEKSIWHKRQELLLFSFLIIFLNGGIQSSLGTKEPVKCFRLVKGAWDNSDWLGFKMVPASLVMWHTSKRWKEGGMPQPKTGAVYTCTVVLYDKGGTIQQAGCLVTGCQIKVASRSHSSRPMASPMRDNSR